MLPERTTTTGDSLPVMHINAFHIISADVTIIPETVPRPLTYSIYQMWHQHLKIYHSPLWIHYLIQRNICGIKIWMCLHLIRNFSQTVQVDARFNLKIKSTMSNNCIAALGLKFLLSPASHNEKSKIQIFSSFTFHIFSQQPKGELSKSDSMSHVCFHYGLFHIVLNQTWK